MYSAWRSFKLNLFIRFLITPASVLFLIQSITSSITSVTFNNPNRTLSLSSNLLISYSIPLHKHCLLQSSHLSITSHTPITLGKPSTNILILTANVLFKGVCSYKSCIILGIKFLLDFLTVISIHIPFNPVKSLTISISGSLPDSISFIILSIIASLVLP